MGTDTERLSCSHLVVGAGGWRWWFKWWAAWRDPLKGNSPGTARNTPRKRKVRNRRKGEQLIKSQLKYWMSKHSESLQQELSRLSHVQWATSGLICTVRCIKQQSGESRLWVYHFYLIFAFSQTQKTLGFHFPLYLSESRILIKCLTQSDHLICLGTKLPEWTLSHFLYTPLLVFFPLGAQYRQRGHMFRPNASTLLPLTNNQWRSLRGMQVYAAKRLEKSLEEIHNDRYLFWTFKRSVSHF